MFTPTLENYNLQGKPCPICHYPFQLVSASGGGGWECNCGISHYPVCLHCGHELHYDEDINGREYVHCPQCDQPAQYGHYIYGAPEHNDDLILYVLVRSYAYDDPEVYVYLSEEERKEKATEIAMEYAMEYARDRVDHTITVEEAFELYECESEYESAYYYQIPVSKSRVLGLLKGGSDA